MRWLWLPIVVVGLIVAGVQGEPAAAQSYLCFPDPLGGPTYCRTISAEEMAQRQATADELNRATQRQLCDYQRSVGLKCTSDFTTPAPSAPAASAGECTRSDQRQGLC